jgi:hypothetical protein
MPDEPSDDLSNDASDTNGASSADGGSPEQRALHAALAQLLAPVARLAVARGLPYAATQELLKQAFVEAASAAHPGLAAHRKVSRIATSTGINRREVTRLTEQALRRAAPPAPRSAASELCVHWRTQPPWQDAAGQPLPLPRLGAAPSFEALAQEVTRDVHARSLLDELIRLGLAQLDEHSDTVALEGDAFVPAGDRLRMLGFLGDNVGDHLRAAVDNVLAAGTPPHLEQALFADGLSAASLEALRPLLREQWARMRRAVAPALQARIDADAAQSPPEPLGRVRLGLYAYQESPGAPGAVAAPVPARRGAARQGGPASKATKATMATKAAKDRKT